MRVACCAAAGFEHLHISVGVRVRGVSTSPSPTSLGLVQITDPDEVIDNEEEASSLPQYLPLRYAVNSSIPDTFLPLVAFANATSVQFTFDVAFTKKSTTARSALATVYFPLTTTRRARAPQPAPETKCMVQQHGVLDHASQECVSYQALTSLCVQVRLSPGGAASLAPMVRARKSSGVPSYGCSAAAAWSPVAYAPLPLEGHSTDDVAVPPVNLTALTITVRSELDPYLHAQVITHDSMTFGLSSRSCLIVGASCLALGALLAALTAAAARRYCRDAMADPTGGDASQPRYHYGQLEDAMNDNVLSPASSMSVYSLSPAWRHRGQSSLGVEMFPLQRGEDGDEYG
ncbi:hypothetical protein JKP88DRAFT_329558 [Tribonema minus]|uniref:Uncharacterized protein n=1 Tax=Tribonema minus TaxID=303371 RepID=A0A835YNJ9_9STRA|nr:hypothetical protein JKP88DRAFT_329558 [Tribonema minus]